VTEIITLPLGRVMSRGWELKPVFLKRKDHGFGQGSPVALNTTNEFDRDLVGRMFMAVMKCLRS
jgi:hypothetical protein